MKPSQLSTALTSLIDAKRPVFVWGPPGVCKSSVIRQVAAKANRPLVDIRAVLLDPVDLRGLPKVNGDNKAHWCPPAFLPYDASSTAVIFLDELAQAPPLVQSACLQLTLDRRIGEYELPPGCVIIAASNRQEDRAGAHRLITPLLNRFVHLEVEVSNEDWHTWALQAGIDNRVRSFINWKPSLLFNFDPKSNAKAFPTPRSWEFVSDCIKSMPSSSTGVLFEVVKGCVGEGAAGEFMSFVDLYTKLPDPKAVLSNPDSYPVPTDASVLYALSGALVECLRQDGKQAQPLAKYAIRMQAEFAVLTMRDAAAINPAILNTPEGNAWCKAHSHVVLGQ